MKKLDINIKIKAQDVEKCQNGSKLFNSFHYKTLWEIDFVLVISSGEKHGKCQKNNFWDLVPYINFNCSSMIGTCIYVEKRLYDDRNLNLWQTIEPLSVSVVCGLGIIIKAINC